MILTTEEVLTNLTNALAAEQNKNKILAEQKAVLLEMVVYFKLACKQILEGGQIDAKHWEWECEQAIKQAN